MKNGDGYYNLERANVLEFCDRGSTVRCESVAKGGSLSGRQYFSRDPYDLRYGAREESRLRLKYSKVFVRKTISGTRELMLAVEDHS